MELKKNLKREIYIKESITNLQFDITIYINVTCITKSSIKAEQN